MRDGGRDDEVVDRSAPLRASASSIAGGRCQDGRSEPLWPSEVKQLLGLTVEVAPNDEGDPQSENGGANVGKDSPGLGPKPPDWEVNRANSDATSKDPSKVQQLRPRRDDAREDIVLERRESMPRCSKNADTPRGAVCLGSSCRQKRASPADTSAPLLGLSRGRLGEMVLLSQNQIDDEVGVPRPRLQNLLAGPPSCCIHR
jgi:hypothetical protein